MAFKTFAPGVLSSSDMNTFLMRQAVITCTAATRPASPNEGMLIYETDTKVFSSYNGAAWVDVPSLPAAINPQTGSGASAYTFVLADALRLTTASNASAGTYTIPPQGSVAWLANSVIRIVNYGAGVVTIAGGAGVTVTNSTTTLSQYDSADLIRTGSDAWTLVPFWGKTSITQSQVTNLTTDLAAKANLASPMFTGTPAAPTATAATNTTQIATTAFVTTADNLKANLASPTFTGEPRVSDGTTNTRIQQTAATFFIINGGAGGISVYLQGTERIVVSNAGLITGSGSSLGAWTTYTPVLTGTGWAVGNGTITGRYSQIGKQLNFRIGLSFGSTTTAGSVSPTFSLPAGIALQSSINTLGIFASSLYVDVSLGSIFTGQTIGDGTTGVSANILGVNGQGGTLNTTSPFTWATGDLINIHGTVEIA